MTENDRFYILLFVIYMKIVAKYSNRANIWQNMLNEIQLLAAEKDKNSKIFRKMKTSPSDFLWHLSMNDNERNFAPCL